METQTYRVKSVLSNVKLNCIIYYIPVKLPVSVEKMEGLQVRQVNHQKHMQVFFEFE